VIEIQYQGPSESFAWVLPIPDGEVDVGVSSKVTLDRLDQQSNPNYQLNRVSRDDCRSTSDMATSTAGSAAASTGFGGGGPTGGGAVVVVEEGIAGPYVYQVLSVSDDADEPAAELVEWLQERDYDVEDSMTDLLEPYLESGLNMLAFKLDKNQDSGSIRPAMITYESDVPFIPLRPTAMAALEDMGVKVWVLGPSRAVPTTYLHLELNESLINWFNPGSNYNDVVIAAADEAGGMGFVTEQSGPAAACVDAVYSDDPELGGSDAWRREQLATTDFGTGTSSYQAFFTQAIGNFSTYDGFLEVMSDPEVVPLREGAGVAQFISCVQCYFAQERGAGAVYPPTPFDPAEDPILDFDAFTFLDAIDEHILEPMAKTRELFEEASHVTRMYTTISPDEMVEDPAFDFNSELEDVDNQHTAEQLLECNGSDWTITLPEGMEIRGTGNTWPVDINSDMPANLRIYQLSSKGEGMEIEDNTKTVARRLRELEVPWSESSGGGSAGGGCRSAGHAPSKPGGWLVGLLLLGAALFRRRRSSAGQP
jgi:MYXO-CTERM domain-containing protein